MSAAIRWNWCCRLAIGGVDELAVNLVSDNASFNIGDAAVAITNANYTVDFTHPGEVFGNQLFEGGDALPFNLAVSPLPVGDVTVQVLLTVNSRPNAAQPEDFRIADPDGNRVPESACTFTPVSTAGFLTCDIVFPSESGVSGGDAPTGTATRPYNIRAVADADFEGSPSCRLLLPVGGGLAWDRGISNVFFCQIIQQSPPGTVQPVNGEISQVRGYHATVTYLLPRAIAATDTGNLTVNITEGDLGTEAFAVSGRGDFACVDADNRCTYTLPGNAVGESSLDVVLSLALLGEGNLTMTLVSGNLDSTDFPLGDTAATVIRANYAVVAPAPQIPSPLTEGAAPTAFAISVFPPLAVPLTAQLLFFTATPNQ